MFELDCSLWLFKYQNDGPRNIIVRIHWVPVWDQEDYNMGLCLVYTHKPPFIRIVSSLLVLTRTCQFFFTYSNSLICADFFWTNPWFFFWHDFYICSYYFSFFFFFIQSLSFTCISYTELIISIIHWIVFNSKWLLYVSGTVDSRVSFWKKCVKKTLQKTGDFNGHKPPQFY